MFQLSINKAATLFFSIIFLVFLCLGKHTPNMHGYKLVPEESFVDTAYAKRVYRDVSGNTITSQCMFARVGGACSYKRS